MEFLECKKMRKIKSITITEFGILEAIGEDQNFNLDSITGHNLEAVDVQFIKQTEKIIGKIGVKFGIRYSLEVYPGLNDIIFCCKIIHPQMTNPKTQEHSSECFEIIDYESDTSFDYYCFEYDWEIKLGKWIFQIIENDEVLAEKIFDII